MGQRREARLQRRCAEGGDGRTAARLLRSGEHRRRHHGLGGQAEPRGPRGVLGPESTIGGVSALPRMYTDLLIDWSIKTTATDDNPLGAIPLENLSGNAVKAWVDRIEFVSMKLDGGAIVTDFLVPSSARSMTSSSPSCPWSSSSRRRSRFSPTSPASRSPSSTSRRSSALWTLGIHRDDRRHPHPDRQDQRSRQFRAARRSET